RGPGVGVGQAWLGSYRTFAGEPWVWCIDAGKGAPFGHYKWTSRQVEAPQEAYLLWKYGPQANDLNHAALSFLVHKSAELPHDQLWKIPDNAPRSHGGPLAKRVEELRKEATDFSGPYEVRARLVDESGAKLGTAPRILIDDVARAHLEIEVRSAGGELVPGVELSLRKDDGKPGLKGIGKGIISESKPVRVPVEFSTSGEISFNIEAEVPPTGVALYESDDPEAQRVISALKPESAAAL